MTESKKDIPSKKQVLDFMIAQSHPYRFEYAKDIQPLRVSVERKVIYVNEKVLMDVIRRLVKDGLDWKEIMRKNTQHEKAHERFFKWNIKWGVSAADYGWLASYLTDIVIDKIYFAEDASFQKALIADCKHAFKEIKRDIWSIFPTASARAPFLYTQAAYWVTIGAITLDEASDLYPEKIDFIVQMSHLFSKVANENDLEWAFPQAKMIYFRSFGKACA
jgi:hypothetical protein